MPQAASTDWPASGECGHAVQFYEADGQLLDLLVRFVGTALVTGDGALVIATQAHRDGLDKRLKTNGLDLSVPRLQGRFMALDAAATLDKISSNGAIDARLFQEMIGGLIDDIDRACGRGERPRVAVFGEMVALLWAQGRGASVIQLEQQWNDLAARHRFSMCCAYPMQAFGNRHAASFVKICAQHSRVFTPGRRHHLPAVTGSHYPPPATRESWRATRSPPSRRRRRRATSRIAAGSGTLQCIAARAPGHDGHAAAAASHTVITASNAAPANSSTDFDRRSFRIRGSRLSLPPYAIRSRTSSRCAMARVASAREPDAVCRNRRAPAAPSPAARRAHSAVGYFAYCCGFWSNLVLQICAQK